MVRPVTSEGGHTLDHHSEPASNSGMTLGRAGWQSDYPAQRGAQGSSSVPPCLDSNVAEARAGSYGPLGTFTHRRAGGRACTRLTRESARPASLRTAPARHRPYPAPFLRPAPLPPTLPLGVAAAAAGARERACFEADVRSED